MRKTLAAAICSLSVAMAGAVQAATFNLFYDAGQSEVVPDGVGVLRAVITGEVGLDGNTVTVTGISQVTFDGASRTISFFDSSLDQANNQDIRLPTLSLDGTDLDFIACVTNVCIDTFRFDTSADFFEGLVYIGGPSFGDTEEDINPSFALTAAEIPLPAPAFLLLAGLGVFIAARARPQTG